MNTNLNLFSNKASDVDFAATFSSDNTIQINGVWKYETSCLLLQE